MGKKPPLLRLPLLSRLLRLRPTVVFQLLYKMPPRNTSTPVQNAQDKNETPTTSATSHRRSFVQAPGAAALGADTTARERQKNRVSFAPDVVEVEGNCCGGEGNLPPPLLTSSTTTFTGAIIDHEMEQVGRKYEEDSPSGRLEEGTKNEIHLSSTWSASWFKELSSSWSSSSTREVDYEDDHDICRLQQVVKMRYFALGAMTSAVDVLFSVIAGVVTNSLTIQSDALASLAMFVSAVFVYYIEWLKQGGALTSSSLKRVTGDYTSWVRKDFVMENYKKSEVKTTETNEKKKEEEENEEEEKEEEVQGGINTSRAGTRPGTSADAENDESTLKTKAGVRSDATRVSASPRPVVSERYIKVLDLTGLLLCFLLLVAVTTFGLYEASRDLDLLQDLQKDARPRLFADVDHENTAEIAKAVEENEEQDDGGQEVVSRAKTSWNDPKPQLPSTEQIGRSHDVVFSEGDTSTSFSEHRQGQVTEQNIAVSSPTLSSSQQLHQREKADTSSPTLSSREHQQLRQEAVTSSGTSSLTASRRTSTAVQLLQRSDATEDISATGDISASLAADADSYFSIPIGPTISRDNKEENKRSSSIRKSEDVDASLVSREDASPNRQERESPTQRPRRTMEQMLQRTREKLAVLRQVQLPHTLDYLAFYALLELAFSLFQFWVFYRLRRVLLWGGDDKEEDTERKNSCEEQNSKKMSSSSRTTTTSRTTSTRSCTSSSSSTVLRTSTSSNYAGNIGTSLGSRTKSSSSSSNSTKDPLVEKNSSTKNSRVSNSSSLRVRPSATVLGYLLHVVIDILRSLLFVVFAFCACMDSAHFRLIRLDVRGTYYVVLVVALSAVPVCHEIVTRIKSLLVLASE
ncbi:unnamed protein product [Amoebophrya sp. A25]|nr:unnamed protein product [Amoebophrya sp. A25]|eukprot:GSA25T00012606001.1